MTPATCRLFVIKAGDAASAVVIRRGPSRWYQIIQWDMESDRFIDGSWFHGRIYEEKCDLSPDGKLLVYFALKHIKLGDQHVLSYTALSRSPWLHALAIWPQDTTYGGGGRFLANRQLSIRGAPYEAALKPFPELPHGLSINQGSWDMDEHRSTGEIPDSDWCGRDHRGRTIYSQGGKLLRIDGKATMTVADFSFRKPHPQPPPDFAKLPLSSK